MKEPKKETMDAKITEYKPKIEKIGETRKPMEHEADKKAGKK